MTPLAGPTGLEVAAAALLPDSRLLPPDLDIYHVVAEANYATAHEVGDVARYLCGRYERANASAVWAGDRWGRNQMIVKIGAAQHDVRWSPLAHTWYPHVHADEPRAYASGRDGE